MNDFNKRSIKGYELRDSLGAGGFGAVYRAYQAVIEREVAIKVILPQFANQPDFIRGFEAEARMVARLEHPHIVPLYDYWRDPDGAYIVMRLLRGGSLQDKLRAQGRLSVAETQRVVAQLGPALMVAHRNGIIHRDLKPPNIMLDEDENAYLSDFGISKDLAANRTATEAGSIVGSPAYLSPEQITGGGITPAADIYSLGVMIYEMLTGQHPYADATTTMSELITRHLSIPMPPLYDVIPGVPEPINDVLQRATAKDPNERYPDVISAAKAFRAAAEEGATVIPDQPLSATPPIEGSNTLIIIDPNVKRDALQGLVISDALITFRNPYKGLRAFEEGDAGDFFGRSALIEQLLVRLMEPHPLARFLAVVGASGSGKSSVVKAGLVPALRDGQIPGSEYWYIAEITPGAQPLVELENCLLGVATRPPTGLADQLRADERGLVWAVDRILSDDQDYLLLVIDQFEELFTSTVDADEREQFLDLLRVATTDPASRLRIVITLRADFMDRPLQYVEFGDMLRQRIEFVLPMTPAELEQTIAGPAERVGMTVEPELLAAIMADLSDEPGALPLLQYALTELFEQRTGPTLTLAGYQKIGGVLGALARRAEDIFNEQDADLQTVLRQICLRLVTLGEGTEDTRRRVRQSELAAVVPDKDALQTALDTFGKPRLLTFDRDPVTREPTVEVAHEALIREWGRLRQWLDDSRDDIRLQRRLAAGVAEWCAAQEDTSYLLSGAQLAQFESWAVQTDVALTPDEQNFIAASVAERERLETLEKERQTYELQLQKRSVQLFRVLAAVMAVAFVLGLILTVWALGERSNAQNSEAAAQQDATRAYNAQITAEAAQGDAENARETAEVGATEIALNVTQAFAARATAERHSAESQSLALAAQAQQLDASDHALALALALEANQIDDPPASASLTLRQLAPEPDRLRTLTGHISWVYTVAISPNGQIIASGSADHTIRLWNVQTGELLNIFDNGTAVMSLVFSPNGQIIASGLNNGTINLWDITTGDLIDTLKGHTTNTKDESAYVWGIAFSPDGRLLASGSVDQTIRLWNVQTGELLNVLEGYTEIYSVVFSPDGQNIASSSWNGTVKLWDTATGNLLRTFEGHAAGVSQVVFDPKGKIIASSSWDNTIKLWDVSTGKELKTLVDNKGIRTLAFSPDGQIIVSGVEDGTVKLWAVQTSTLITTFTYHTETVEHVAFSPDGRYIASCGHDETVQLAEINDLILHSFGDHTDAVYSVVFSPDGQIIASGSEDGTVKLWTVQTGDLLHSLGDHTDAVYSVVFSPGGQVIASGAEDGTIKLWDVQTGDLLHSLDDHTNAILSITFSPDGQIIAAGAFDGTIKLWDVQTGDLLHSLDDHTDAVYSVVFSPGGQIIASGAEDGTIKLWDVQTGDLLRSFKGGSPSTSPRVVFSSDGQYIIFVGEDTTARLVDVQTGDLLHTYGEIGGEWLRDIGLTPDDQMLFWEGDTTVELWNITAHTLAHTLRGISGSPYITAFSPDGQFIVIVSYNPDGNDSYTFYLDVFDVQSGHQLFSRLTQFTEEISDLDFSPDGQQLVIGSWDNTVEVWDLSWYYDPAAWTQKHRILHEFTCEERERFRIEPYCEPGQDIVPTTTPSAPPQ